MSTSHIYWINIDERVDRRTHMTDIFAKYCWQNTRIPAVVPSTMSSDIDILYASNTPNETNLRIHLPSIACIGSHIKAAQVAQADMSDMSKSNKLEHVIIMEDDIIPLFDIDFSKIVETAPTDWDILKLHTSNKAVINSNLTKFYDFSSLWSEWVIDDWSTVAYVLNRKTVNVIAAHMDTTTTNSTLDLRPYKTLVADVVLYQNRRTYSLNVPIFKTRIDLGSDIKPQDVPYAHVPANLTIDQHMPRLEAVHRKFIADRKNQKN